MDKINNVITTLKSMGIRVKDNRVNKLDFRRIFGAKYKEPEWILMTDYKLEIPQNHLNVIEKEESKLGRVLLPSSYLISRFGQFFDEHGNKISVDGVVYQYSLKGNPRNIHFAFRLFLGTENIAKSSGITTSHAAKEECSREAKKIIEVKLFDLT